MWWLAVLLKSAYCIAIVMIFLYTWVRYSICHSTEDKACRNRLKWKARFWLLVFFISLFAGGVLVGYACQILR